MRYKNSCVLTTVSVVLLVLSFPMPANSAGDAAQLEEHELRISNLERRVLELEAKLRAASGSGVTLTSNPTLAAWRKIQEGMTWREVRAVLGEPKTIDGGNIESWYYSNSLNHSNVRFLDGRVRWWNEPR